MGFKSGNLVPFYKSWPFIISGWCYYCCFYHYDIHGDGMDDGDSCGSGGDGSCGDSGGDLNNVNKTKMVIKG